MLMLRWRWWHCFGIRRGKRSCCVVKGVSVRLRKSCSDPASIQFPFQDEIAAGESGHGYVLRMSSGNGLRSMVPVKQLLGKSHSMALDANDAPYLAHWFGASVSQLSSALEQIPTGKRSGGCGYAGQTLGRSYFLNRSFARVCPNCLDEQGYCRAAWDFSLCVACVRHQRALIDSCPTCARALSWSRPALGICCSGCPLIGGGFPVAPSDAELVIAQAIDMQMCDEMSFSGEKKSVAPSGGWSDLIRNLNLDGMSRVVYALATCAAYDELNPSRPRSRHAMTKSRETIKIAAAFGSRLAKLEPISLVAHRPSALIGLLCELVSVTPSSEARESSTAQSILGWLLSNCSRSTLRSQSQPLAQRALF